MNNNYSYILQAAPGTNSNNYYVSGLYYNNSTELLLSNGLIMKMNSDDSILWSASFNLYTPLNPMALDEKEQSIYFYGSNGSGMTVLNLNASSGTIINQK